MFWGTSLNMELLKLSLIVALTFLLVEVGLVFSGPIKATALGLDSINKNTTILWHQTTKKKVEHEKTRHRSKFRKRRKKLRRKKLKIKVREDPFAPIVTNLGSILESFLKSVNDADGSSDAPSSIGNVTDSVREG